jgi:hypothetical protein
MAMDPAVLAGLSGRRPRVAFFFNIAGTPPLKAWSGVGAYHVPQDSVETTVGGADYLGVGILRQIPRMDGLINGKAARITVSLSGVSSRVIALADTDWPTIRGSVVSFGIVSLDANWQPAGAIAWIRQGVCDRCLMDRAVPTRVVGLSIGFGATDRRRPPLSFWSPRDQAAFAPGDRFCERTPIYNTGSEIHWPHW